MNISVKDTGIETFYSELNRIGFYGLDVRFPTWEKRDFILSDELEEMMMGKYKQISDAGLNICQTHLTYYPGNLPLLGNGSYKDFEEYMLPILIKEIELVPKMNCNIAVIHLYFEPSRENSQSSNLLLIKKLLPVLEKNNVILSIENIYGPDYGDAHLTTAEDLLFYTDYFQSNYIGICLDTGHAITRRQDPVEMLNKIGGALKALHLHSNVAGRDLHLPPCVIDNVDWQKFYNTLIKVGYSGAFNMEILPPKQINKETALAYYRLIYAIADSLNKGETKSWIKG